MSRAKQGSVVLEASIPGGNRIPVAIVKGTPQPPPEARSYYARYTGLERVTSQGNRSTRYVDPLGENLAVAWKRCQEIELDLHAKRVGLEINLPPTHATKDTAGKETIAAAVAEFIHYSESRVADWRNGGDNGLSPNSLSSYRKACENFRDACAAMGAVYMTEFRNEERGEAILLNFKNWLDKSENVIRRGGKAAYSNSRKFTVIGQMLARNGFKMKTDRMFNPNDPGLIDHKDAPRVKKPKIADVVYYTPADIKAMLSAADTVHEKSIYLVDDLKDLILTFVWTGMRDEEVQHLTWADINWKNGDGKPKATVQDKPKYDWRVKDHEKRIVTLPEKLKKRLLDRQAGKGTKEGTRANRFNSELIFPTSDGTPNQNFADHITALQKRAIAGGYQFSRPETRTKVLHNFRRSYATMQMLNGVPVRNIQDDLGHSELSTTERYLARVDNPDKVRAEFETIG